MIKKLPLLVFFLSFSLVLSAQKEANNWYFGNNAGLKFSGASVTATTGSLNTPEGCSSVSNAQGNLLFYTDGISVWNKNHTVMPNGTGLLGGSSATQAALVVPSPSSPSQFYIFTVDEFGGGNGFRYSIVDTTLNGGTGDVTTKNIFILGNVTEKIAAVQSPDKSYWVVAHEWGSDAFYTYHLTTTGLSAPIISNVGTVHNTSVPQNTYGQMKFAGCGQKLAVAIGYQNTIEVFDFNVSTGIVSNPMTLSMGDHVYGVEFSVSANYLYASCYDPSGTLVQFDISSGDATTTMASKVNLTTIPDVYGIQLGPNEKIYVVKSFSQFLGVINSPDIGGTSCNYVENGFDLDPGSNGITASLSLPSFMQSFLKGHITCTTNGIMDPEQESGLTVYPNPSAENFVLELPFSNEPSDIKIYDVTGRVIEELKKASSQVSFGNNYSKGVYILSVRNGTAIRTCKIIKA